MPRDRKYDDDYYSDSPPRHRSDRHRDRDSRRNRPDYREEEIIEARGPPAQAAQRNALIRRQASDESIEEVRRDFPPGGDAGYARRTTRRARSQGHGGRYDDDYDDYYDDRRRDRRRDGRKGHHRRDYSSSSSESPPPRRRKSLGEQAMEALGIGGLAGAAAGGGRDRSRDRGGRDRSRGGRRSRRYSSSSSSRSRTRARSKSVDQQKKIQQAVKAALIAGAGEAFRSRKEPGGWKGDKGKRVLTAAIGAGGIDGIINGNKDPDKKGTRHTLEAVIGGLAGNRLINGARDKSASRTRSRSRDRGRHNDSGGGGMLEKILGTGAAAAGATALLDRARSKSRGRRDYSSDSDDSRDARRHKRSKSVTDYARSGMAALGIGGDKKDSRGSRRGYDDDDDYYSSRGPPREARLRGGGGDGGEGVSNSSHSNAHSSSDSNSDSDSGSSSEDEREQKKMRGKELLTAGLASVATIHAAHNVYQSMEGRKKRHKEVMEGKMSPAEARKKKYKARLQDAASIGIAAIGIKGAIGEWKEMREQREEFHEFEKKRQERHERRLRHLERLQQQGPVQNMSPISHSSPISYSQSNPNLAQGSYPQATYQTGPYWNGPHYADGNPYAAEGLPPPPMGPQQPHY